MPRDARLLVFTRALRGFADGAVSVVLAAYLARLGFGPAAVGALVTATLLGSAALTLFVGLIADRLHRRTVLLGASMLMIATGLGFAGVTAYWPLFAIAFAGTINPSAGDVTVFLPTEQAALADASGPRDRTELFAWYNLAGALAGALGALAAAIPEWLAFRHGVDLLSAERALFAGYAGIGLGSAAAYLQLSPHAGAPVGVRAPPLQRSRKVVLELAALFSLDSFGGGFVVQSLLALWLFRRFGMSLQTAATVFFFAGVLSAFSQLVSARLAARIGHVRTMVFTHLPANLFLILAGLMPTAELAVLFLLLRMALSQMDVPARQAYVMALVPREERAAAASVTNVPRSLAAAISPLITGWLLEKTVFGWPLILAGALKAVYDLVLYRRYARVAADEG